MFCIYLRTNSDLCYLQHKLIGFYNRDVKCAVRNGSLNKTVCASFLKGYSSDSYFNVTVSTTVDKILGMTND